MPDDPDSFGPLAFLTPDGAERYREGSCVAVVRTAEEFQRCLRDPAPGIEWLQIEDLIEVPEVWELAAQGNVGIPLDVILRNPASEFSALYRLVDVSMVRSVRVTIPAKPGLMKAVRLAASLQLPVRILPGQPDARALAELSEAAQFYLHDPMVESPIEFFHSLLACFRGTHTGTLWKFLEQDPAGISQADSTDLAFQLPDSIAAHLAQLLGSGTECSDCPWQTVCSGYFKWPDPAYSCAGVKALLSTFQTAAEEISRELADRDAAGQIED